MKPRHNLFLGSLFVVALSQAALAQNVTLYWDGSDLLTSGAQGGAGTWNTNSTANWWDALTSLDVVWPATGTDNDAVFGGTAGTVTIAAGGVTANDITFNTTGYTLTGGTLTLNGTTPTITNATGIDAIIASKISGSAGLTKAGGGILTLSGANDYTGITTISGGILKAGSAAALGSNAQGTTVSSGATLDIGGQNLGTEVITISGTGIGGNGAIINSGGQQIDAIGRIVLAADATIGGANRWDLRNSTPTLNLAGFTLTKTGANYIGLVAVGVTPGAGNIIINQGELNLSTSTNLNGTSANSITVNNGGTLGMYQSSSAHAWTLNLNNGSSLRGENGTTAQNRWAGSVNVTGTANLLAESGHNLTISGNINGSGGNINKTGAGTVILSGTNGYTGTTTISNGTLSATKAVALAGYNSASKISVSSTGTLAINYGGGSDWTSGEIDSLLANNGSGFAAGSRLQIDTTNGAGIYASNIGISSLGLTKVGANSLTLSGTNAYTGTTTISAGTLQINSASAIGGTQITTSGANNAALVLNDGLTAGSGKTITIAGGGASQFFGALSTTGTATWQGNVIIGAATGARVGTLGGSGALTISGDISEPLGTPSELIIRTQNSVDALQPVILTGNNSYTGGTRLTIGTLRLGSANAIGTGTGNLTISGGTTLSSNSSTPRAIANNVVLAGSPILGDATFNGKLTFNGTTDLGGATRTFTVNSEVEFANTISVTGTFGLEKTGGANLILSGNNTYSGVTTISGGRLIVRHVNALGATSGNTRINNGGTLELSTNTSVAAETLDMGSGNTGTIVVNRADNGAGITHSMGAATLGNGTLNVEAGVNVTSGTARLALAGLSLSAGNSGTMTFNPTTAAISITGGVSSTSNFAKVLGLGGSNANNLISGVISNGTNTVSVVKTGTSTWELSNDNSYTGQTSVNNGTLILSGNRTATMNQINVGDVAGETGTLNIRGNLSMAGNAISLGATAATATGIINHSAGLVSFTSGNALLIGRSTGGVNGTYNLSGGELKTFSSTERGIMIGTNAGTAGNLINSTFNLSGTGILNNATGALQVVRGDATSGFQNSAYNQTGGTSTNGYLIIGGGIDGLNALDSTSGNDSIANFSVTGGTFTATNFNGLSRANNVVSTMTIGGTADVTLPAFPTARGTSSTATLYFDGGVLRPTASSTTYLGGLTNAYINGGGAKFNTSNVANTSSFDITVSQNLLAGTGSGGLTKEGAGTLTLSGSNTYVGGTTITAGTLALGHASDTLLNAGAVQVNGATAILDIGANSDTVGSVTLTNGSITGTTGVLTGSSYAVESGSISARLGGAGVGMTKSTAGTVTLSGVNTFTGDIAVNAGTLAFASGLSLSTTPVINLGDTTGSAAAILQWNNNSLTTNNALVVRSGSGGTKSVLVNTSVSGTVKSLELNDNLTKGNAGTLIVSEGTSIVGATRTLAVDSGELRLSGTLSSAGNHGLTKTGAGILRLNGNNSGYAGTVTLSQASLHVGHANALGTGEFVNNTNANTITNVSGAAITLSNSSYSVSSSLIFGGTTSDANINTGAGAFNLVGSQRILSVNSGVTTTIGGAVSGDLRKDGSGTLVLDGTGASLTGIRVVQGNLQLTGSTAATTNLIMGHPTGGNIGKFILGGTAAAVNQTFGSLSTEGSAQSSQSIVGGNASVSTLTVNQSTTTSYAGKLGGAGTNENNLALIKDGLGTLNLTGISTYTGNTTVTGGTLALSGGGSFNNSAVIDVQSSGILSIAGVATSTIIGGTTAQTLKGLGSVDLGSKTLTIGGSGTLAPGASPGTLDFIASVGGKLDFSSGSIIEFELGTLSDLIAFDTAGDWLSGSGNATLALTQATGFSYANTYTIFQNVNTTGFTLADITGYDTGAYTANFVQSGSNYNLSFTPIPEPRAALLGGLGMLLLLRRRRD